MPEPDKDFEVLPILDPTSERMVPESSDPYTFWEHVYRYAFASRFVKGKRVLDIACGEGYGAAALRGSGAASVIGIDISDMTCGHAKQKYGIDARIGSAENIPLPDNSVDVVVSFETIEHVSDTDRFLDECVRILAPGGRLIISTPNMEIYSGVLAAKNPYHCSEMTEAEFVQSLRARFRRARFYTQRPLSAAWWSPRTLVCEDTPWKRLRGFRRLRASLQRLMVPEASISPTATQRSSAATLILHVARSPHRLLNQYVVRPHHRFYREKPLYLIATAVRSA